METPRSAAMVGSKPKITELGRFRTAKALMVSAPKASGIGFLPNNLMSTPYMPVVIYLREQT